LAHKSKHNTANRLNIHRLARALRC